jgi:hypothetical protein
MIDPVLDRSRPYNEVRNAYGSVMLEQDGNLFNLNGDFMTFAVPKEPAALPPADEPEVTHYDEPQDNDQPDEPHAAPKRKKHHR